MRDAQKCAKTEKLNRLEGIILRGMNNTDLDAALMVQSLNWKMM